ncbi:MAG: hydantoinase/oxoprolinase family protein [Methanotrichaceae archaeon]
MLVGIDVGGTTTDAAIVEGGRVIKTAYVPTNHDNLMNCLLDALDELTKGIDTKRIERVVLSTTLITNMIAEGKTDPVALLLIPGPGANPKDYNLGRNVWILEGAIDYRGREIDKLNPSQIKDVASDASSKGFKKIAVVGKFGQRNHAHELKAKEIIENTAPGAQVEMGHKVSGQLNFPRRAATTMLTVATKDKYKEFSTQIDKALKQRKIHAPVYILKADGGTLPLDKSIEMPVETIFSGPAASIMGVMALTPPVQTSVVVDIGGTTTDLALILSGRPLLSSKGAKVESLLTHIRAFAVKSVAIGGDSVVNIANDCIAVGPHRDGPALCMGGPGPTPTDAMRVLGMSSIGDLSKAQKAMDDIAHKLGVSAKEASQKVVDAVVLKIVSEVNAMFQEWEQEPAYRVWEIMKKEKLQAQNVVGVGGGAPPLVPLVAQRLGARSIVPEYAPVANAIGAAVARPTMTLNLRIDTERGEYTVSEEGLTGKVSGRNMNIDQAEEMARKLLAERAFRLGIGEYAKEAEVTYSEIFNMVRGWSTVGRLLDVRMEIPAGILEGWRR